MLSMRQTNWRLTILQVEIQRADHHIQMRCCARILRSSEGKLDNAAHKRTRFWPVSRLSMQKKTDDELRAEIRAEAHRYAQAQVYSLQNEFTDVSEKLEIESWFQLPTVCAGYAFLAGSFLYARGLLDAWQLFGIACGADLLVAIVCWFAYNRNWVVPAFMILRFPVLSWSLHFIVAIWFFAHSRHWLGGIVLASLFTGHLPFGFPSITFYKLVTLRYAMNPKYAFLKHFYAKRYPFESSAGNVER